MILLPRLKEAKLAPIIEQYAEQHPEIKVLQVDTDTSPKVAAQYGIKSIPTTLVFQSGVKVGSKTGMMTIAEINKLVLASAEIKDGHSVGI